MDYEKKYKEEVGRATQLWECGDITRENLEYIFPELKESEDERIREELLELAKRWKEKAKGFCPEVPLWPSNEEDCDRYIAWLEKQGEKSQGKSALEAINEEKVDNQNCVKPIDKVEPKFHEGDWIVDKSGFTQQVLDFRAGIYTCTYNSFTIDCESNYHLWTIADAKDGDVLCTKNKCCPFIYDKGRYNNGLSYYYAGIDVSGNLNIKSPHNMLAHFGRLDNSHPATPEQRALLFSKMNEAGYEWDAEKKVMDMNKTNKITLTTILEAE